MCRRLAILAFAAALGVAAGPGVAAAAVVDCDVFAYEPNLKITSARNMTCRRAVREMRRYRGSVRRCFRTPGGFWCTRVSAGELGGQWRCVRRSRAFRFEFGD